MEIKSEIDKQFFLEMNSASDRTAAVASSAYLDDKLSDLLKAHLRQDKDSAHRLFKPTGPLGSLQVKNELAYMMGLYSQETRNDIEKLAAIRNKFAHWAEPVTFGHSVVRDDCHAITLAERLFAGMGFKQPKEKPWPGSFAKYVFVSTIDQLCGLFIAMAKNPGHSRHPRL